MWKRDRWMKKVLWSIVGLIVSFFALALLQPDRAQPTIRHIRFKPEGDNRLRFKVEVETEGKTNAALKYWEVNDPDTLYSTISENNDAHKLWIVNIRPERNYKFQVIASDHGRYTESKIYDFSSQAIYQATPFLSLEFLDSTFEKKLEGKYFLTQKLDQPGAVIMLDHKGEITWYESFKKGVRVSHWTNRKTVLCILGADSIPFSGGDEIVEVALSGEILTHFMRGRAGMDKVVHHDVRIDEHDNIYALTFDWKSFDLSGVGGTKQDSVLGDGIVVFDRQGNKVWEWSVFDHLDPLKDPNILKDRRDWVHANSLIKDSDGDYLISFRDLNQIWKVNATTGKVTWKFGKGGDFALDEQYFFSGQHGTHTNSKGQLLMLDNGLKNKLTRVLAFNLDTLSYQATTRLEIKMPKEYFSIPKGSVYEFDDENYLLCLSQPRSLLIVNSAGDILWKVVMGGDPYRLELIRNPLETSSL
jgi:arylsulfate sulfotransferase